MFNFRFHAAARRLRRHLWRVTALGLLVALAATSLGVALPGKVVKQTAVPFPCMNSPCGCANAETCWRSCCCHSHAEKLAWAREHGVTPPDYVVAESGQPACCQKKVIAASCCSAGSVGGCCRAEPRPQRTCCENRPEVQKRVMVRRHAGETGKRQATQVLLVDALRCQGLGISCSLFPPTIVPPTATIDEAPAALSECVATLEESFHRFAAPPDVPPPKRAT